MATERDIRQKMDKAIDKTEEVAKKAESKALSALYDRNLWLATGLFAALTPGLILTVPPQPGKGMFMTGVNPKVVLTHTGVFAAAFMLGKTMLERQGSSSRRSL